MGNITIRTFKGITGCSPSEFSARQIKEQLLRNAKAIYGMLLDENDPEPYPGFKTTVPREKVEEIINELVQMGLVFFGQPGKIAWDRSINPGEIQGLLFTAFNKETFSRKDNDELLEIILPQLISVYPLENSEAILQPLFELIPAIVQQAIAPTAVGELQDGKWSMFGTGDEQGEKTKKLIQMVLEHPNNQQKGKELTQLDVEKQETEALEILYDAMRHETGHIVALRLTDQLFDIWGSLVDKEMDAILAENIPDTDQMVGNFFLKEMVKGRNGASRAEEEGRIPVGMSKQELARYKFQIELFCDKWALFVDEKMERNNIPLARNGLQLTDEQRDFFEQYLQKVLVVYKDGLMNFSAKAMQMRIYKITGILAA